MNRIEVQDKGKGASDKGIHTDIRRHKRDEAERRNFLTPAHLRWQYWTAQGYSRMSAHTAHMRAVII